MNIEKLDKLYQMYGYSLEESEDKLLRIYRINYAGMYSLIELVDIGGVNEKIIEKIKEEYKELDYGVKTRKYSNLLDAENILFEGFFDYIEMRKRLKKKYDEFSEKQVRVFNKFKKKSNHIKYKYMKVNYSIIGETKEVQHDSIISNVLEIVEKTGAYLIIIEAAAGFGKTCSAYEILKTLYNKNYLPLMSELSKDRTARIFKHVLLSTIDREYKQTTINSSLVEHQIKAGNIPLIIDGFDELITKSLNAGASITDFDEAESMLSTVSNLLVNNSKIILTSRKTAIFSGNEFLDWTEKNNNFKVIRFTIKKPEIQDWLEKGKLELLREKDVQLQSISNPVLLSYLKYLDIREISKNINSSNIIEEYFNFLLSREKERQNLSITEKEQFSIYRNLAGDFLEWDILSETKDFIMELILERSKLKLEEYLDRYSGETRPSINDLIDTLSNHALLDRKNKEMSLGFVNDFIFGILAGEYIIKNPIKDRPSDSMMEVILTSFYFYESKKKNLLWERLNTFDYSTEIKILMDTKLRNIIIGQFNDTHIANFYFDNINFTNSRFSNTTFSKCIFCNSIFSEKILSNITFSDCTFDNINFKKDIFLGHSSIINSSFKNCAVIFSSEEITGSIHIIASEDYGTGVIKDMTTGYYKEKDDDEEFNDLLKEMLTENNKLEYNEFLDKGMVRNLEELMRDGVLVRKGNILKFTKKGRSKYKNL